MLGIATVVHHDICESGADPYITTFAYTDVWRLNWALSYEFPVTASTVKGAVSERCIADPMRSAIGCRGVAGDVYRDFVPRPP